MSAERTATLRTAEKLLRVGKIAAAIAEYTRAVQEWPDDWDTAILLASLHARSGDIATAVDQYRGMAIALSNHGHHDRATGVLERVLILQPGDEDALAQLAEAAAAAGDIDSACLHLQTLADARVGRGDLGGGLDALERAATLDPARGDAAGRLFELCVQSGDFARARAHATSARDCRTLATLLQRAGQDTEAHDLLREAYRLDPSDLAVAAGLARDCLRAGDIDGAMAFLPPAVIGDDPAVQGACAALFLQTGRDERALELATQLVTTAADGADRVAELACATAATTPETAYALADIAISHWVAQGTWASAVATLELFVGVAPGYAPALIRLIEVAVDGDRLDVADRGQELLANAYLAQGDVTGGLAIAEDLAERDPLNPQYEALLQRARDLATRAEHERLATTAPMRAAR